MNNKMNKESNQYLIDSLREDHKRVYKQIIEEIDKVINISYSAIDNFGSIAKNESKNYYDNIETEFNDINEDIINLKISFDKTRELKNRVTEFTNAINKVSSYTFYLFFKTISYFYFYFVISISLYQNPKQLHYYLFIYRYLEIIILLIIQLIIIMKY